MRAVKVGLLAPAAVPATWGGAERAVDGLRAAIERLTSHEAEVVRLPVNETTLTGIVGAYRDFSRLDVSRFDQVISVKYPAWMASHPLHTVLMFHPLRGLYDTYHLFGLPLHPSPQTPQVAALRDHMTRQSERSGLPEFFDRFAQAVVELGSDHPDLAFPGPFSREVVHWFDRIALAPGEVNRHFALSRTVANRADYFPPGVRPRVVYLPGDLDPAPPRTQAGRYLFTASRLDGAKRLDLVIDAMAHVATDVTLKIAGTGPLDRQLRERAAHDPRIEFCGFVPDDALRTMYADALAVPFVPDDEDLGLVVLEAFSQATPVVTCTDSGGPTEFVHDGVTGLVAAPNPSSLGQALDRLARDPGSAAEMGRAAQARGARVTWARAVDALLPPPAPELPIVSAVATAPVRRSGSSAGRPRTRPKVLVLATFTIDAPRHGGELRARNLYGALAEHADVHLIGLVGREFLPSTSTVAPGLDQTVVPRTLAHSTADDEASASAQLPVTDILSGINHALTPAFAQAIAREGADADLVVLAEPYLHPALVDAGLDVPFIYDAYNVESILKERSLPATDVKADFLHQVRQIERAAVTEAGAVVACSADDAAALAGIYGRNLASFVVIPNGTTIRDRILSAEERAERSRRWRERYRRDAGVGRRIDHLAVFFGSWHPPNLDAAEMIIELADQLPHVMFLLCGHHGEHFRATPTPPNVVFPGTVTNGAKTALLDAADVALNPMRSGSGTNLKLIEYLTAGVPVVSTPFGARGVEVVDGEHLLLAPPERFADAIATVLADPEAARRRAEAGRDVARAGYDWSSLGDQLSALVADLARPLARQ
ncbi:MAG: glycosyltransferase family 4 protein [Aquihabitans sp.]